MAKQNFLAGGYYGKLGDTVGQRWRNIRTVRAYVIPANPRTQAQQANRGKFGDCVLYAQISRQMQGKALFFQSGSTTEWNGRMSTARTLQDNGFTELNRIPLYPNGFTPNYLITGANITEVIDTTHIKVTVEGNLPESKRLFTMIVKIPELGEFPNNLALCDGENSESDLNVITFRLPENLPLSENMECRIVSCDDISTTENLICSSQIPLSYVPIDTHEFDTTFVSLARSGYNYTLTLNEPYQDGTNEVGTVVCHCVVNGQFKNWTVSNPTLINNNGKFAISFASTAPNNQMLPAFPSGAYITISSISSRSSTVIATAENKQVTATNDDLSRTYKNKFTAVERSGDEFTFTPEYYLPLATTRSGSTSIHCVKNGAWVNTSAYQIAYSMENWKIKQNETVEQNIFAFPAGSTTDVQYTIVGNGVTYTPEYSTAQAISNTSDLIRAVSLTSQDSEDITQYLNFNFDAVPTLPANIPSTRKRVVTDFEYVESAIQSNSWGVENNSIYVGVIDSGDWEIPLGDSYFYSPSNIDISINGVTYRIPANQHYELSPLADFTYSVNFNGSIDYFNPRLSINFSYGLSENTQDITVSDVGTGTFRFYEDVAPSGWDKDVQNPAYVETEYDSDAFSLIFNLGSLDNPGTDVLSLTVYEEDLLATLTFGGKSANCQILIEGIEVNY